MERNFNKIVIVSLWDGFSSIVATMLSQNLGMMFCDTKDLIEYELIDKKALEELCTEDYLKNAEKKVFKHISSFENVVVSISFDYLIHNLNILKNRSLFVFLNLPKKHIKEHGSAVDEIAYEDRTKKLQEISTISINLKKIEPKFVCDKIIDALGRIL